MSALERPMDHFHSVSDRPGLGDIDLVISNGDDMFDSVVALVSGEH